MKSTDKAAELEKQVSESRARYYSLRSRAHAPRTAVRTLVDMRAPVRTLLHTASNAELCSLLYSNARFQPQLAEVKEQVRELSAQIEARITERYPQDPDTVALRRVREVVTSHLNLGVEPRSFFTAVAEADHAVPVYALRYSEVADAAGFVHRDYAIWFKNNRCFSTGFAGWPTENNWITVKSDRELLAALAQAVAEDGFGDGGAA